MEQKTLPENVTILDLSPQKLRVRLEKETILKHLTACINYPNLQEIILVGCELGDICLRALARILGEGKNKNLHTIDLRHNKLTAGGLEKFSPYVQNNFFLTKLLLEENYKLTQFDKSKLKQGADFYNEGILTQFNYGSVEDGVGAEKKRFDQQVQTLQLYCEQNETNSKVNLTLFFSFN